MTETKKTQLRASLIEAMNDWLNDESNDLDSYEGDELPVSMADAALAVIEANCRAFEYATRELRAKI